MEYLSLYDFLGKAAGKELGTKVKEEADKIGVPFQIREISNPKYEGKVLLYPRDFLEFYFREPDLIHMNNLPEGHDWTGNIDDDLPF
jgi:hypothetical protein